MVNGKQTAEGMGSLNAQEIRVAIDHAAAGYSSLLNQKYFPIQQQKQIRVSYEILGKHHSGDAIAGILDGS